MIRLKSLVLESHVMQAPMAGCTDLPFRLIARARGMRFGFHEMVLADALVRKNRQTLDLLKTVEEDRPIGAQIVGADPAAMADAAAMLETMGMDLVDINCGCPAQKITASGAGARLLSSPKTAEAIFRQVCRAVQKIPVTVKIRKGFLDPSGSEAVLLARMAEDAGAAAVTVHGRMRAQSYAEKSDWDLIRDIRKQLAIPVIGNGDVFSGTDAKDLLESTGCAAVMVGRGGLGNPWIYREIDRALDGLPVGTPPDFSERAGTALEHLDHEIAWDGERRAVLKFRHIADWYLKGAPGVRQLRHQINGVDSSRGMKELISAFCALLP